MKKLQIQSKRSDGSFISGSSWQSLDPVIGTSKDAYDTVKTLMEGGTITGKKFEQAVNYFSYLVLHYSNSEWSNDYYDAVNNVATLAAFLPQYSVWGKKERINPVNLDKEFRARYIKIYAKTNNKKV